jgi:hypothetical protein
MNQELYTPAEAIQYLKDHRGMHITAAALRQRRHRGTAKALKVADRVSLWTKEELDAINPSSKPGRPRKEKREVERVA